MELDLQMATGIIGKVVELIGIALNSKWFLFLKFIIGIYTFVLLADIILMLSLRGLKGNIIVGLKGAMAPVESSDKFVKRWGAIMTRLNSGDVSQFKAAILEADTLADEVLARIGHGGENMGEKLQGISSAQIDCIEALRMAHEVRNQIIHDKSYDVDEQKARQTLSAFEDFLKEVQVL